MTVLSDEARAFLIAHPFVAIDIGARGGLDDALLSLAFATELVGFEPEPEEAARLAHGDPAPWKARRIIPTAISGTGGRRTLFIPQEPRSASLLEHNRAMVAQFGTAALHDPLRRIDVDTVSLDDLARDYATPRADYIKIDVEGAEDEIIAGGTTLLKECLAMKVEVSFLEQRRAQPLIWDVAARLRNLGFLIIDIVDLIRWRMRFQPAEPLVGRGALPSSKGVAAQADLIAFRDPDTITDPVALGRLALLAAALGYCDWADGLLRQHPAAFADLALAHRLDLSRDIRALSQARARPLARAGLMSAARGLIPLARSVLSGLPVRA